MSSRDQRFVAQHRGGKLSAEHHRLLASWAADCAEHLLLRIEHSGDVDARLSRAVAVGRTWAAGEASVGRCQQAALAAHAAARESASDTTTAIARACGHAVATAHMADHSLGVVYYGHKAVEAAGQSPEEELTWQLEKLPKAIHRLVLSGLERKYPKIMAQHASHADLVDSLSSNGQK